MTAVGAPAVVVVGTGVAGLSAAVSAAEAGARVHVVERAKEGSHGGNTRYTEAFLRMQSLDEVSEDFADRFAEESGYHTDPIFLQDSVLPAASRSALTRAAGFLDPDVIGAFAEHAGPTLRWLEGNGVAFEDADTPFITASTTRLAPVGGGLAIVEALTARAKEAGVVVRFETTATGLSLDDAGTVVGLVVRDAAGRRTLACDSVVLASGGFQGNPEMVARYTSHGQFARPIAIGGYYDRGEGIAMALDAGAAPCGDFSLFHAEPIDPRSSASEPAIFAFSYGILVNREGVRFVDEAAGTSDATYEAVTRQILEQPGGIAYVLFDEGLEDVPNYRRGLRTDVPPVVADTVEGLAERLGLPEAALAETVAHFNKACVTGEFTPLRPDGLGTTGLAPAKSHWARPLERGPFRAYPVVSANVFTFGGVKVDEHARVLDGDGRLIRGLYAAGEVMGLYYGRYTGSTSVLRGAVFGRRAGLHSAASGAAAS